MGLTQKFPLHISLYFNRIVNPLLQYMYIQMLFNCFSSLISLGFMVVCMFVIPYKDILLTYWFYSCIPHYHI